MDSAMTNNIGFKTQVASIMEVLANAAVAEICKLIDDDYAVLRLQITQSHNDNRILKRKLQMMELKLARDRAERIIRERAPSVRTGGRTSVSDRSRGWRGGGHSVHTPRERVFSSQEEHSWRSKRAFSEELTEKQTSQVEESTVIKMDTPVMQIKQENPEAGSQVSDGTSWTRVLSPGSSGIAPHSVTAEPLTLSADQGRSRETVEEGGRSDLDSSLTKLEHQEEERIDETPSFSLGTFNEPAASLNHSTMFSSGPIEEFVPPSMDHSAFSSVVKLESEEGGSCANLDGPSTSDVQWPGVVGVEWNAGFAPERLEDHRSTSDTLECNAAEDHNFASLSLRFKTSSQRHGANRTGRKRAVKRPLTCSVCGLLTRSPSDLATHLRVHTGERPYSCSICSARFTQKGYLNVHLRGHTGEKPFICPYCGKCFSLPSSLKTHMRIHTGERPFTCSYCCKGFTSSKSLRLHQRRVHADLTV